MANMAEAGDWRGTISRQRMITNISNLLKAKNINVEITQLSEYENGIFTKSSSYDDYKQKLSKLIHHLQTIPAQKMAQLQGQHHQRQLQQQQMAAAQQQQQQQQQPPQMQPSMPGGVGPGMQPGGVGPGMPGQPQMHIPQMSPYNQPVPTGPPMSQQMPTGGQHMNNPMSQSGMMSGHQPNSLMSMGGPYSADPPFIQSPAPSQPQIPAMFGSRPAYSPGPPPGGVPMQSPTQALMRHPQPSPSMSMNVNTPAPHTGATTPQDAQAPSPASFPPSQQPSVTGHSSVSDNDQMYMDKIRELSSYIEPLKKMLNKMAKEGKTNQNDYNKLCVLLNLLQPNNSKTSYDMLCRCEDVLKKLKLPTFKAAKEGMSSETSSHWCQPLLTAVAETINTSGSKNVLRQMFGPANHILYGPNLCASQKLLNVTRKRKLVPADTSESGSASRHRPAVPHLIQGELARLESKFRVSRDTSQAGGEEHDSGLGLRLRCHIDDEGLPAIPVLKFTLPDDYPDTNPLCDLSMNLYDTSDLFIEIKKRFISNLKKLQNKYSMTAMLETWLMSVGQTCSNLRKEKTELNPPIVLVS